MKFNLCLIVLMCPDIQCINMEREDSIITKTLLFLGNSELYSGFASVLESASVSVLDL